MKNYMWVELGWQAQGKFVDGPDVNTVVHVICEATKETMHLHAKVWFKDNKFKGRPIIRSQLATCYCLYDKKLVRGKKRKTYLITIHGATQAIRASLFAHESQHLVMDFYKGRKLPKGTRLDREEHQCRMQESLMEWYMKEFENEGDPNPSSPKGGDQRAKRSL